MVSERFRFLPTRQPVALDLWEGEASAHEERFSTIGNWRQRWRSVRYQAETVKARTDLAELEKSVARVAKGAENLEEILTWAGTIKNNNQKILDKAERIRDDLDKQVGVLREPGATDYGLFTPDHDRTLSGIHKRLLRRRHR